MLTSPPPNKIHPVPTNPSSAKARTPPPKALRQVNRLETRCATRWSGYFHMPSPTARSAFLHERGGEDDG